LVLDSCRHSIATRAKKYFVAWTTFSTASCGQTRPRACAACASEYAFEARVLLDVRAKLERVNVPATLRQRIALRLAAARASPTTES
jgi:hypothetical protein